MRSRGKIEAGKEKGASRADGFFERSKDAGRTVLHCTDGAQRGVDEEGVPRSYAQFPEIAGQLTDAAGLSGLHAAGSYHVSCAVWPPKRQCGRILRALGSRRLVEERLAHGFVGQLTRLWDRVLMGRMVEGLSFDELRKGRIATFLVVVAPVFLVVWGVRHLQRGDTVLGTYNLCYAGAVILSYVLQRAVFRASRVTGVYRFHAAALLGELVLLLSRSSNDASEILWLYIYPLVMFYLLGTREGFVWVLCLSAVMIVFLAAPQVLGMHHDFSPYFRVGFAGSFVLVVAISAASESARRTFARETESHERALKEEAQKLDQARSAAEDANRAKSDLLARVSHDLRTPLGHILGFTELTVDGTFGDLNEGQREHLDHVLQSGRHLLDLINDVLDLSAAETGGLTLELQSVDLGELLEESLRTIGPMAAAKDLSVDLHCGHLTVDADRRRILQVLHNLLSNAVKFTPQGGSVAVECMESTAGEGAERFVEVRITDTGIGLEPANLDRVFDEFVRTDPNGEGTGLGLAIARRLIELHGGRIRAESQGPGRGSVFSFALPAGAQRQ